MSRLAKKPISVPDKVEISVVGETVKVKGGKAELTMTLPPGITVQVEAKQVSVVSDGVHDNWRAFQGLAWSLVRNMITGVSTGWSKELELVGIGYRAAVQGRTLSLSLGYSHPIDLPIPDGLDVEIGGKKMEILKVSGADKDQLGEFAALIRSKRPPEPYKGKGVRYKDEQIKLKAGKRVGA